tara:strand:- start:95 stop:490 length:396 start_codon:yes stop_codon:yes gene_type:complete
MKKNIGGTIKKTARLLREYHPSCEGPVHEVAFLQKNVVGAAMATKNIIDICGVVMKKSDSAATAPINPHHWLSFFKPKMKSGRGAKYKKRNAKNEPLSIAPKKNMVVSRAAPSRIPGFFILDQTDKLYAGC